MSVILVDDQSLSSWRFEQGTEIWIGRHPERNDIVLPDDRVSRRHVALRFTTEGAKVVHQAGTSGTFVDSRSARPGDVAPFGSAVAVGGHHLFVTSPDWFVHEPPGALPATAISSEDEFGQRLSRYVDLPEKEPDDQLWLSLYLKWRSEVVESDGDERRVTSFNWVLREASRMASPTMLHWLRERIEDVGSLAWFFGRGRLVVEALVFAEDPIGPLLANEIAETEPYRYSVRVAQLFKEKTAGGSMTTHLFDVTPRDRPDVVPLVDAIFRRAWRRKEPISTGRFRDLLRNSTVAEAAEEWVFVLVREGDVFDAFRPSGGELVTLDGDLRLPDHSKVVVASPRFMDEPARRAWELHLAEHEIAKPFAQW